MGFESSFHQNFRFNSSVYGNQRMNNIFPNQENLKFSDSNPVTIQGSRIDPCWKPLHFYVDPFLQPCSKFSAPPPQNQNSFINKNALFSSNATSYADFVNLPHIPNQSQSVNFQGFRSSSVSVNPCIGVNRPRDDQRVANRDGTERKSRSSVRGHWNQEEDRKLVQLVGRYGTKKWSHIARLMPGRFGKQLRERYNNHLRPGLKREAWAEEEDLKLIEAHEELGNKWAEIARRIPGRSESDIKNRWNATKRKCLNAIKKSRTNPKPSSLFEDYVKNIFTKREPSSTVTGESNEIGGPSSGGSNGPDGSVHNRSLANGSFDVDDGSLGLQSSYGPSVWTADDCTMGQFGNMTCMDILSSGPRFLF